jgi:hypothetical protein
MTRRAGGIAAHAICSTIHPFVHLCSPNLFRRLGSKGAPLVFLAALLAIIVFLPIPLGNMLPALAICLLALGILERDGVWILAGLATAAASVALVWGVLYALIRSALFLLENAFN